MHKSKNFANSFLFIMKKLHVHHMHVPSGHLTSEHFLFHRYIWYIFLLVCSVFVIKQIYHVMFYQAQHSGHEGINPTTRTPPPLSWQAPPLNQQTVDASLFLAIPAIYMFFKMPAPP